MAPVMWCGAALCMLLLLLHPAGRLPIAVPCFEEVGELLLCLLHRMSGAWRLVTASAELLPQRAVL